MCGSQPGSGGGGATHIATRTGLLSSLASYQSDVLIVAGGGGGGSGNCDPGHAGGYTGGSGVACGSNGSPGGGGTQNSGGSGGYSNSGVFGQGGDARNRSLSHGCGGGGGGWYGGGGGYGYGTTTSDDWGYGGGGGSGYLNISKLSSGTYRMYCYASGNGACSTNASYYTYAASNFSDSAISNYAKDKNGYAKITRQS